MHYGAFPLLFRRDEYRKDMVRLGSAWGGWWVPGSLIRGDSICYLGGVGGDVSFDLALIDRYGCEVWAFDPTPRVIKWYEETKADYPDGLHFVPCGFSDKRDELKFYLPENPQHVSSSVKNLQGTGDFFSAPVQSIKDTMSELGHDRLDLLKLDIEGAEHDTIRQMLDDEILPTIICVEYDQPEPLAWARQTTRRLRTEGYKLVHMEEFNLTFVRE
jgi:FkbM family methyltransferase